MGFLPNRHVRCNKTTVDQSPCHDGGYFNNLEQLFEFYVQNLVNK